ncbi:hypothetical protein HYC85_004506 [Camellia sinensis]|uniref:Uncharacterized protein n=1 Tax=Camellia sinensis TaxID=4442 RepID=A0A7J7HYG6_CAMSI|nr:hypothetical protein HYC85_004506 [Camellia sinensis]
MIDQSFYGDKINGYKDELGAIGVMFNYNEVCQFIGKHLMALAASTTLTRVNVVSILTFIKFLREKLLSPDDFIHSIREGRWLRTTLGYISPVGSVLFNEEWKGASEISDIPFIDQNFYGDEILNFKRDLEMLGVVIGFNQNYKFVADNLKSPAYNISAVTAESGLFVLKCLKHLSSSEKIVSAFKGERFLKTNMGYKAPSELYLFNPQWGCLLEVFNGFPRIDENFYGTNIVLYNNELKQLGVVVDFEEAAKAFSRVFKQQAEKSSINKDNVLSFLACCRKLNGTAFKLPDDLKKCIREVKWLRTRLGDYRVPSDCILFGPEWESISPITLLPFIDDSDNYYGKGIHEYKKELKRMRVVLDFKDGYKFVAAGIYLPSDPSNITLTNVYALLECVRNLLQQKNEPLPDPFLKKISKEWLKTSAGYMSPEECLLFDSNWSKFLQPEEFYGPKITSYSKELNAIKVTVDVRNGCSLLGRCLNSHSNFATIVRIYSYLREFNWVQDSGDTRKMWIPNGSDDGEWVKPEECVLYDKDGLFGLQLKVLENYYDSKLLRFFSNAWKLNPIRSLMTFASSGRFGNVLERDCPIASVVLFGKRNALLFWKFVVEHWSSKTDETLAENLLKLPVFSGSDEILLVDKRDVFITDDLQLKDLFEQSSSNPLFVWYPQPSLPSLPRFMLLEIYSKIGVRNISESVLKEVFTMDGDGLEQVNPSEILIGKGLVKLILGFLAGFSLKMEEEKRHEAVRSLLDLTVIETNEPITIGYSLSLSSGERLKKEVKPMIRWERDSKLFTVKMDRSGGHRSIIEYATCFSEAISEGLLWEKEDHIRELAELIKLGFVLEFNEEAIEFLMKTKNLQLFLEDDRFMRARKQRRLWFHGDTDCAHGTTSISLAHNLIADEDEREDRKRKKKVKARERVKLDEGGR